MIISDELPQALAMGIDYDLFWTLNPKSIRPFVKAFVLKQEYDVHLAWTNGMYVRMAIASVMDKNFKYPKHPSDNKPRTEEQVRANLLKHFEGINSNF